MKGFGALRFSLPAATRGPRAPLPPGHAGNELRGSRTHRHGCTAAPGIKQVPRRLDEVGAGGARSAPRGCPGREREPPGRAGRAGPGFPDLGPGSPAPSPGPAAPLPALPASHSPKLSGSSSGSARRSNSAAAPRRPRARGMAGSPPAPRAAPAERCRRCPCPALPRRVPPLPGCAAPLRRGQGERVRAAGARRSSLAPPGRCCRP